MSPNKTHRVADLFKIRRTPSLPSGGRKISLKTKKTESKKYKQTNEHINDVAGVGGMVFIGTTAAGAVREVLKMGHGPPWSIDVVGLVGSTERRDVVPKGDEEAAVIGRHEVLLYALNHAVESKTRKGHNTGGDVLVGVKCGEGPPPSSRLAKSTDQESPKGSTDVLHGVEKLGGISHSSTKREFHGVGSPAQPGNKGVGPGGIQGSLEVPESIEPKHVLNVAHGGCGGHDGEDALLEAEGLRRIDWGCRPKRTKGSKCCQKKPKNNKKHAARIKINKRDLRRKQTSKNNRKRDMRQNNNKKHVVASQRKQKRKQRSKKTDQSQKRKKTLILHEQKRDKMEKVNDLLGKEIITRSAMSSGNILPLMPKPLIEEVFPGIILNNRNTIREAWSTRQDPEKEKWETDVKHFFLLKWSDGKPIGRWKDVELMGLLMASDFHVMGKNQIAMECVMDVQNWNMSKWLMRNRNFTWGNHTLNRRLIKKNNKPKISNIKENGVLEVEINTEDEMSEIKQFCDTETGNKLQEMWDEKNPPKQEISILNLMKLSERPTYEFCKCYECYNVDMNSTKKRHVIGPDLAEGEYQVRNWVIPTANFLKVQSTMYSGKLKVENMGQWTPEHLPPHDVWTRNQLFQDCSTEARLVAKCRLEFNNMNIYTRRNVLKIHFTLVDIEGTNDTEGNRKRRSRGDVQVIIARSDASINFRGSNANADIQINPEDPQLIFHKGFISNLADETFTLQYYNPGPWSHVNTPVKFTRWWCNWELKGVPRYLRPTFKTYDTAFAFKEESRAALNKGKLPGMDDWRETKMWKTMAETIACDPDHDFWKWGTSKCERTHIKRGKLWVRTLKTLCKETLRYNRTRSEDLKGLPKDLEEYVRQDEHFYPDAIGRRPCVIGSTCNLRDF